MKMLSFLHFGRFGSQPKLTKLETETEPSGVVRLGYTEPNCRLGSAQHESGSAQFEIGSAKTVQFASPTLFMFVVHCIFGKFSSEDQTMRTS